MKPEHKILCEKFPDCLKRFWTVFCHMLKNPTLWVHLCSNSYLRTFEHFNQKGTRILGKFMTLTATWYMLTMTKTNTKSNKREMLRI